MSYNGWRNRETWLVNVWFNPETKQDIDWLEEELEEKYYKLETFWQDFIWFQDIDWDELRNAMEEEEDEE